MPPPADPQLPAASAYHIPVLATQTIKAFAPTPRIIVDATMGGGGHTELLLKEGHQVIGLDRDLDSLAQTAQRLNSPAFTSVHANFSEIGDVLERLGVSKVDGILADFGVSSHQLDEATRGFSFLRDGPLDMRMNQTQDLTAKDIIHTYSQDKLQLIFQEYGEERFARKIARSVVEARTQIKFETTHDLASFILQKIGKREKIHPATRVFQALRIEVNNELGEIKTLLKLAPSLLSTEGRLALISFHSLEDRLVKRFIRQCSTEMLDRPEWGEPRQNPEYCLKNITKKPLIATAQESKQNPRSRTAKMRIAEKI